MAGKKIPMRQCVGCRELKAKKELLRVVAEEAGAAIDPTGKKNGRGAYICADPVCLEKARKARGLERSLKTEISSEIYENLKKELSAFVK